MDSLLLPSQSTCLPISSRTMCPKSSGSAQDRKRVSLSSAYSRVQTKLSASVKVADQHQLRSVKGRRSLATRATVATEEGGVSESKLGIKEDEGKLAIEEETVNEPKLSTEVEAVTEAGVATEEGEGSEEETENESKLSTEVEAVTEAQVATEEEKEGEEETENESERIAEVEAMTEAQVATEEEVGDTDPIAPISVEDAEPTNSGSEEAVAQSVELLKTAARTRKVSASEIIAAFKVLDKAKLDPTDFLSLVGGTKSPGRTWLLIFNSSIQASNKSEGSGKYFPVTAVQNFDAEAKTIENGIYLGALGELAFMGNFVWAKRKLSFNFYTLKLKIGPFGPFSFSIGSPDKEITNTNPFFIWVYADDEIIVGKGKAGGTAFWVRCARVNKSFV